MISPEGSIQQAVVEAGPCRVSFGEAGDGDFRDDPDARAMMASALGIPSSWAFVDQVHGTHVIETDAPGSRGEGDVLVTSHPELPIAITTADCVPLVLMAEQAVAVVHCGWRGIAAGVVERAVATMTSRGSDVRLALMGPHIGPCCYEVGNEVVEALGGHESTTTFGTRSVDLAAAIRARLPDIEAPFVGSCTKHDSRFHSYRDTATPRRQVTVAWIQKAS